MRTEKNTTLSKKKCLRQRLELPVPVLLPTLLPAELQRDLVALLKVFDKPTSLRHHENSQLMAEKLSKVQLHVKLIQAKRLCD